MADQTVGSETASTPGAWTCRLTLPYSWPIEALWPSLRDLARVWPVAALMFPKTSDNAVPLMSRELLLYRDPSTLYGAPDTAISTGMAVTLARALRARWCNPGFPAGNGVLVPIGLREGYDTTAPTHDAAEVACRLPGAEVRAAHLVSARQIETGRIQWYDEPAAVVHTVTGLLPDVLRCARDLGQLRVTVVDTDQQRTYAVRLDGSA